MTATLIAADEPRPQQPQTPPQPSPSDPPRPPVATPWWQTRVAEHRRGTNPVIPRQRVAQPGPVTVPLKSCGCIAADVCDCSSFAGPAVAFLLRTRPIVMDLHRGVA